MKIHGQELMKTIKEHVTESCTDGYKKLREDLVHFILYVKVSTYNMTIHFRSFRSFLFPRIWPIQHAIIVAI